MNNFAFNISKFIYYNLFKRLRFNEYFYKILYSFNMLFQRYSYLKFIIDF